MSDETAPTAPQPKVACICREIKVNGTPTGLHNWHPECQVHTQPLSAPRP